MLFVHLAGTRETIGHRLAARTDHFMPAGLLDSQLATLEPLEADENALVVDVAGKSAAELAEEILDRLRQPTAATGSAS